MKVKLKDVEFEIESEKRRGGEQLTGALDDATEAAAQAMDDVIRVVSAIAESTGERLREVAKAAQPDEATVSFTVGVKAGAGIVVKSAEASGSFTVQLKWIREKE